MKRIIAAVDDAESALQVARFAAELAAGLGTDLVLVTVARVIDDGEQPDLDRYRREEHVQESVAVLSVDAARYRLTALHRQLDNTPGVEITCEVLNGSVAEQLASYARLHAVDLIVIGHRSRSRLAGLLAGSVAKHVIDTAPCPVLVVR